MGEEFEKEKQKIRSVLIANGKSGVRLRYFAREFEELQAEELQYKAFGFSSVADMLQASPDAACIGPDPEYPGEARVFMVADADTAHIANMQMKSRTKPMKPRFIPPLHNVSYLINKFEGGNGNWSNLIQDTVAQTLNNLQLLEEEQYFHARGFGYTPRAFAGYQRPGPLLPHYHRPQLSGHRPLLQRSLLPTPQSISQPLLQRFPLLTPLSTHRPPIQQSGLLRSTQVSLTKNHQTSPKPKQQSSFRFPAVITKTTATTTANVPVTYTNLSEQEMEAIKDILASCPYGALNSVVEKEYKSSHRNELPGNWVEQMSGMINVDKVYGEGMLKLSVLKKESGSDTAAPPIMPDLQQQTTSKMTTLKERANSSVDEGVFMEADSSMEKGTEAAGQIQSKGDVELATYIQRQKPGSYSNITVEISQQNDVRQVKITQGDNFMNWREPTKRSSSSSNSIDADWNSESDEDDWSQPVTISPTVNSIRATDFSAKRAAPYGRIFTVPTTNSTSTARAAMPSAPTAPPPLCALRAERATAPAPKAYAYQCNALPPSAPPQLLTVPPQLLTAPTPARRAPLQLLTAPPPASRALPPLLTTPPLRQSTLTQTRLMKRREDRLEQTTCPPVSLGRTPPPLLSREDGLEQTTCPPVSLGRTPPPLLYLSNSGHNQHVQGNVDPQFLLDLLDSSSMGEVFSTDLLNSSSLGEVPSPDQAALGDFAPQLDQTGRSRFDDSHWDSDSHYSADSDNIDNRKPLCICSRGQGLVLCNHCFSCQPNSRVRMRCEVHPGAYWEQDDLRCPAYREQDDLHCPAYREQDDLRCPACHSDKISVLYKSSLDGC